jgi:hypothetical protein
MTRQVGRPDKITERAAIVAEFALMAADPDYQVEAAQVMRDFEASDRESWAILANPMWVFDHVNMSLARGAGW